MLAKHECLLDATLHEFFDLPLDYFFAELNDFLGHGLLSPFRVVCHDFILPETANRALLLFQFAQFIVPYRPQSAKMEIAIAVVLVNTTAI